MEYDQEDRLQAIEDLEDRLHALENVLHAMGAKFLAFSDAQQGVHDALSRLVAVVGQGDPAPPPVHIPTSARVRRVREMTERLPLRPPAQS